jgi:hypothetical protein
VPQATPGLDLGAHFARMRLSPLRGRRQGLGEPRRLPCLRGAPRRWGGGDGGTS